MTQHILNRIATIYTDKIVEIASRNYLHRRPLRPNTLALLSVVPVPIIGSFARLPPNHLRPGAAAGVSQLRLLPEPHEPVQG